MGISTYQGMVLFLTYIIDFCFMLILITFQVGDGSDIPPFSKRKSQIKTKLMEHLDSATKLTSSYVDRRDLGELVHIFSHVKHNMGVEHLHFKNPPSLSSKIDRKTVRWMNMDEMQDVGITTGVKKIRQLVFKTLLQAKKRKITTTASSNVKRRTGVKTTSQVSDSLSTQSKPSKPISSFFQK